MSAIRFRPAIASLAFLAWSAAVCHGQYDFSEVEPSWTSGHDYRLFEPSDLDLDNMPVSRQSGYLFNYDKLYMSFSGERTIIGVPGGTELSEQPFANTDNDAVGSDRLAVDPYTITNGITDAPPHSGFGWGDRYEFGFFDKDTAYTVSVLDGPHYSTTEVYGFLPNQLGVSVDGVGFYGFGGAQDGTGGPGVRYQDDDAAFERDVDQNGDLDPNTGTGVFGDPPQGAINVPTAEEILNVNTLRGFGSVHVVFEMPTDFNLGWRDYGVAVVFDDADGDFVGSVDSTVNGPGIIIIDGGVVVNGGDGLIDDLDGDGVGGAFGVLVPDPANPGQFILAGTGYDYDDLYRFNTRFNSLQVRGTTTTAGVELMRTHTLSNRHKMAKHKNLNTEFGYGVRLFQMKDDFRWDGISDVYGRIYQITGTDNTIVGPQVRLKMSRQAGKWNTSLDGRVLFGFNIQDVDQRWAFGEDTAPGAINRSVIAQPTYSRHGRHGEDFSPMAEVRFETRYQFTKSIAAKVGFTGTYIDSMTRSSQVVRYRIHEGGILDTGKQGIFMGGLTTGLEFIY